MKLKRASWQSLHDKESQQIARLAAIASNDAWQGGARALSLASRMPCAIRDPETGKFLPGGRWELDSRTARDVVSDVYGSHDGTSRRFMAYECPECGNATLGEDAAYQCCAPQEGEEYGEGNE